MRMNRAELARTAQAMVAKGKGILAADESAGTIKKPAITLATIRDDLTLRR